MAEGSPGPQYEPVKLFGQPRQPERREICSSRHRVTVHHPAYESTRLFEISAFDGEAGGAHHGTLLLLCGIIAGGIWDGWLSEKKGGSPVTAGPEDVLTNQDYYYHRPFPSNDLSALQAPYKYPVVLSLDGLTFPHGNPPPSWTFVTPETSSPLFSSVSVSSMSQAVRDRDERCILTRERDTIERAHLCRRSAADWFTREELERYNESTILSGPTAVDDMNNAIALREDVHIQFDKGTFIFVRKHSKWVPHFLNPTKDLGPKYHNVLIDMPAVSEAFILVNIADAILSRIFNFLVRGEKRAVFVKRGTGPPQTTEMTGTEIRLMLDQSKRQRNKSPQKRPRNPDPDDGPGDIPDGKRPCLSPELEEVLETPSLTPSPISSEQLRRWGLQKQREQNKHLCCCDYDTVETSQSGVVGGDVKTCDSLYMISTDRETGVF